MSIVEFEKNCPMKKRTVLVEPENFPLGRSMFGKYCFMGISVAFNLSSFGQKVT